MTRAVSTLNQSPRTVFFVGLVVVAVSSVLLPTVTGYGTQLFQAVVLGAWSLVANFTSSGFADQHDGVVLSVAAILNVALFGIPALVSFVLLRNRAPGLCVSLLGTWVVLYLACLFLLFPATDGP